MIVALLLIICLSAAAGQEARADIYRYVNEEGVACFTDAPSDKSAVRVLKEQKLPSRGNGKTGVPHHLTAGIAEKIGTMRYGTTEKLAGKAMLLPVPGRITSLSGFRHDPIDGKLRHHNGVDIATPQGTPIKPVAPGIVLYSGARPGYGNTVIMEHADGTVTLYAHNSANLVSEGEYADQATTISLSGSTGRSTGPHLHFEAWRGGENITATFTPGANGSSAGPVAANRSGNDIRRIVQADGTLLFTNLPRSHP